MNTGSERAGAKALSLLIKAVACIVLFLALLWTYFYLIQWLR